MSIVPSGEGATSQVANMDLVVAAAWLNALADVSADVGTAEQLRSTADVLWPPEFRDDEFAIVSQEAARQARTHFRDVSATNPDGRLLS